MTTPLDTDRLDAIVTDWANEHHCPSIAWGVVADGGLAATGAVGAVHGAAPTHDTVYRIASMTKSFSAALTFVLRDEGVLRLDEPISTYAPELTTLAGPTADAAPITVRDLLAMSSGLVTDDAWADRHLDLTDDEFDAALERGLMFAGTPGATWEYSNYGYAVLGRVVHRATGQRLQDLVRERLLEPLGLTSTTWVEPDHDGWAPPLRWLDGAWVDEIDTPGDGLIAPMGGLWTTVSDLATWITWLADAFPARDDPDHGPLTRSSRREMQTPQRYVGSRTIRAVRAPTAYGYGLRMIDEPGHGLVVAHSGGLPGYGSSMRWSTNTGVGVIALSNVTYAPMTPLVATLHDELRDQRVDEPARVAPVLAAVAGTLVETLNRWARGHVIAGDELAAVFADNVDPDDAYDRRAHRQLGHGEITTERIEPINAARGRIIGSLANGSSVTVTFALAPTAPHRIQEYDVTVRA